MTLTDVHAVIEDVAVPTPQDWSRLDQAIAALCSITQCPVNHIAYTNLGRTLITTGRYRESTFAFERSIAMRDDYSIAFSGLGVALQNLRRPMASAACCRRAIDLMPNNAEAHNALGAALIDLDRPTEAVQAHQAAIHIKPDFVEAWSNLSWALTCSGDDVAALSAIEHAMKVGPADAIAHQRLANALLRVGDYTRGWPEYEWRWKHPQAKPRQFPQPKWDGKPLNGRTLFLHAEQGLGDILMFCRYVSLLANCGGRVVVECYPEASRLLKKLPAVSGVVIADEPPPAFNVYCALGSLPLMFRTTLQTVPSAVPYLFADDGDIQAFRDRIGSSDRTPQVGLVWAGAPENLNDKKRSVALAQLRPLAIPGLTLHSLQKGIAGLQASPAPDGMILRNDADLLTDLAQTAAYIANLDLVITVDTSIAHLAGAMGKPVWVMLPFVADWRWLVGRDDSPWYPTMRLFRQKTAGDWAEVISRIARDLKNLASDFSAIL